MIQIEERIYPLGINEFEIVENYIDGLIKKGRAIQLGDSTYYYLYVHKSGFNVELERDEGGGLLHMVGDSATLGEMTTHLKKRLGRLEKVTFLKVVGEQSQ